MNEDLEPLVDRAAARLAKEDDPRAPLRELATEAYALGAENCPTITTERAAAELGITVDGVRKLRAARGVGLQISRGTWLFTLADLAAMRERKRVGRPPKRDLAG